MTPFVLERGNNSTSRLKLFKLKFIGQTKITTEIGIMVFEEINIALIMSNVKAQRIQME